MPDEESKTVIGVPVGDPNGIGAEVAVRATLDLLDRQYTPVLLGDRWLAEKALELVAINCRVPISVTETLQAAGRIRIAAGQINLIDVAAMDKIDHAPGMVTAESGRASLKYTEMGVELALSGKIDGIACAPSNKEGMKLAGSEFKGQTEFIGSLTGTSRVSTVLVAGKFRVFQLTGHVSLRDACDFIEEQRVLDNIRTFKVALNDFGIANPLIGVCGLNPHSGDGGLMGNEEMEHIIPAIEKARAEGIRVDGPLPGDTVFLTVRDKGHDGILSMYHDQANAVLKYISEPVSVTIGLPIVRTTVGHGTAYDIAWKGIANTSCMRAAIEVAASLAQIRKNRENQK